MHGIGLILAVAAVGPAFGAPNRKRTVASFLLAPPESTPKNLQSVSCRSI